MQIIFVIFYPELRFLHQPQYTYNQLFEELAQLKKRILKSSTATSVFQTQCCYYSGESTKDPVNSFQRNLMVERAVVPVEIIHRESCGLPRISGTLLMRRHAAVEILNFAGCVCGIEILGI